MIPTLLNISPPHPHLNHHWKRNTRELAHHSFHIHTSLTVPHLVNLKLRSCSNEARHENMTKSRRSPICPIRARKPSGDPQRHAGGPQNSCTPMGPFLKEPRLTAWTAGQPFTRHQGSATPRLPESKPSSSAPLLLPLQHARASSLHVEVRPDTAHALRDGYAAGCYLTRTCGRPEFSQAQPKLEKQAPQRKLRSQVFFPKRRPPQTPSRPGGRAEVTEGRDAAGPAPASPRELPAGNTPGVRASCAAARGAGPAGATRSPHGDGGGDNDSGERRGRAALVRGDVTSTRFTAALRALCLPQPVAAGPAFHLDGAGDAHLSPQPGTAPRGCRGGEQGRSPAAGGGQPGTPQRPRGRPPVSRERTKKAQKR